MVKNDTKQLEQKSSCMPTLQSPFWNKGKRLNLLYVSVFCPQNSRNRQLMSLYGSWLPCKLTLGRPFQLNYYIIESPNGLFFPPHLHRQQVKPCQAIVSCQYPCVRSTHSKMWSFPCFAIIQQELDFHPHCRSRRHNPFRCVQLRICSPGHGSYWRYKCNCRAKSCPSEI